MGNLRRLKKSLSQAHAPKIAMADAHMTVNGCRVFLGHPNERTATASAKGFREMLNKTISRARCPNLHDMYDAHFKLIENNFELNS